MEKFIKLKDEKRRTVLEITERDIKVRTINNAK
jgi:hypothetical protein